MSVHGELAAGMESLKFFDDRMELVNKLGDSSRAGGMRFDTRNPN